MIHQLQSKIRNPLNQQLANCSNQLDNINRRLDILQRAARYDSMQGMEGYYPEFIEEIRIQIEMVRDRVTQMSQNLADGR